MLGRPQGTHCKSGCGLTPWYLKNENYKNYNANYVDAAQVLNKYFKSLFTGRLGKLRRGIQETPMTTQKTPTSRPTYIGNPP